MLTASLGNSQTVTVAMWSRWVVTVHLFLVAGMDGCRQGPCDKLVDVTWGRPPQLFVS